MVNIIKTNNPDTRKRCPSLSACQSTVILVFVSYSYDSEILLQGNLGICYFKTPAIFVNRDKGLENYMEEGLLSGTIHDISILLLLYTLM